MAAKVVTIVGDVTGPQQRHTHKIYLHLVNKIKGVSKYCNKSKTLRGGGGGGGSQPPPPPRDDLRFCNTTGILKR